MLFVSQIGWSVFLQCAALISTLPVPTPSSHNGANDTSPWSAMGRLWSDSISSQTDLNGNYPPFLVEGEEMADDEWRQLMTSQLVDHGVVGDVLDTVPPYVINIDYFVAEPTLDADLDLDLIHNHIDVCPHLGNELKPEDTRLQPKSLKCYYPNHELMDRHQLRNVSDPLSDTLRSSADSAGLKMWTLRFGWPQLDVPRRILGRFDSFPVKSDGAKAGDDSTPVPQLYTLIAIDPDVPTRQNSRYSEFLHWLVVNIPDDDIERGTFLADYVGPLPSEGVDVHRFIFLVYRQWGGLIDAARLPRAGGCDWGQRARFSVRKFAQLHQLRQPEAVNFFVTRFDRSVAATVVECYKKILDLV